MAERESPREQRSLPPEGSVAASGRPSGGDVDTLKAELRKLNARATQAKMDLHDLSEDLPTNWERIPAVAKLAHEAHAALAAVRQQLKEAGA
jgi:hypothetical protein